MIALVQLFSLSVSSVENNQHHCWLVWLLIDMLPDTLPVQWVVTRGRRRPHWPWEKKGHEAELLLLEVQTKNAIIMSSYHTAAAGQGHVSSSATLLTRMLSEDVWVGDPHFVSLRIGGRLVSQWVTPAHELIASKSIRRSTHWANWVPVFVWDDGGRLTLSAQTCPRHAVVCGWRGAWFHILWWAFVLFVLLQL